AIGAPDRRATNRRVAPQIVARDQAVVREHLLFDRQRRLALVEARRSFGGNPAKCARELRLCQCVTGLVGNAVLRELSCRRWRYLLETRQRWTERPCA